MENRSSVNSDHPAWMTCEFATQSPRFAQKMAKLLNLTPIETTTIHGGRGQECGNLTLTVDVQPTNPGDQFPWFMGEQALFTQTHAEIKLTNVPLGLDGVQFRCEVVRESERGKLKATATTTLAISPRLPVILANQPLHQVPVNSPLFLKVRSTSEYDQGYQWYFNNEPIHGAVQDELKMPCCQPYNAGTYTVATIRNNRSVTTSVDVVVQASSE